MNIFIHHQQEAQLPQRDRAMAPSLHVTEYFAKSLKVTEGHPK